MDIKEFYDKEDEYIREICNREHYEDYNNDMSSHINIVVDTENLYLSRELGFPCLKLLDFLYKNFPKNSNFAIHFITKKKNNTRVIQADLKGAVKDKIFAGEYKSRDGTHYKERFENLDEISKHSSIYFYTFSTISKEIDDIFLLYLVENISKTNENVYFYSNDYKLVKDHIYTKNISKFCKVETDIYKFLPYKLEVKYISTDIIDMSEIDTDSNFWRGLNYKRIDKRMLINFFINNK